MIEYVAEYGEFTDQQIERKLIWEDGSTFDSGKIKAPGDWSISQQKFVDNEEGYSEVFYSEDDINDPNGVVNSLKKLGDEELEIIYWMVENNADFGLVK
jgi:hypothetical protein